MKKQLLLFSYALLIFSAISASAQWFAGFPFEVKSSWMKGKQRTFCSKNCPDFIDGVSNGGVQNYNAFVGYNFGDVLILSLQTGFYNPGTMVSTAAGDSLPSLVPINGKQTIIYTVTGHRLEYTLNYLTTELAARIKVGLGLYLIAGASFDIVTSSRAKQSFRLIKPENAQFQDFHDGSIQYYEDKMRTAVLYDADPIPELNNPRIGAVVGMGYVFTIAKTMSIAPFVRYDYQLNTISAKGDFRLHTLRTGMDVWFYF